MHKKPQKIILRRRARSKSRSFTAELFSISEPSCSTISITSIPSPVDEATNDSSISSQSVNEGKREQHKLSSCLLLSYFKAFYLCVPPILFSLLSKLSNSLHLHCMSISSFTPSSFSFVPLSSLCFFCPFLVSVILILKYFLLVITFSSLHFASHVFLLSHIFHYKSYPRYIILSFQGPDYSSRLNSPYKPWLEPLPEFHGSESCI